ncbi:hypothetical protein [Acaryochloris sp. CCMEE 5410]|uniref:hypothetical protein n=1 Tax=Acaryochloris sp. CCMEE 5410 TaxID=310037 RepID=UPI0021D15F17|nr:hypothetical protein [Acaryochloris sp. CCMEE 5410]KAI9129018.1 hypothetical protein ON05_037275 [Acaryochloris sp. CCMEE 5410]
MNGTAKFCFDLGASATKGWVQVIPPGEAGIEEAIFQSSSIKPMTLSRYEMVTYDNSKHGACLGFGDKYYEVGACVDESTRETRASQLKGYHAVAKVLAVMGWYIKHSPVPLEVEVDLLLPSGERGKFEDIKTTLFRALTHFQYGADDLACHPHEVRVHAEGAGIASYASVFPCSILIFGHKDVTLINLKDATADVALNAHTWRGWGTIKLLKHFAHSFTNEFTGAKLIYQESVKSKKGALRQFLLQTMAEKECERTMRALNEAKEIVWMEQEDELANDSEFMDSKKVYMGGGGAVIWSGRLSGLCGNKADVLASVKREIKAASPVPLSADQQLRLIDPYLVWRQSAKPILKLEAPPIKEAV